MRIGIVVDSACDLPADFITAHGIRIAPIMVRIGERYIQDVRDAATTHAFFDAELSGQSSDHAQTIPTSGEEFQRLVLSEMATEYDVIYVLTISSTRSEIFRNIRAAAGALAQQAVNMRYAKGIKSLLQVKVVDSRTLFAGQGAQVIHLVELIRSLADPAQIDAAIDKLVARTLGFMVPDDLKYLYTRAKAKNDRSINLVSYTLGSLLNVKPIIRAAHGETEAWAKVRSYDAAIERLSELFDEVASQQAMEPILNVSYGGPLEQLQTIKAYQALKRQMAERSVAIYESHMSLTAGINVGRGAMAFGMVARVPVAAHADASSGV